MTPEQPMGKHIALEVELCGERLTVYLRLPRVVVVKLDADGKIVESKGRDI